MVKARAFTALVIASTLTGSAMAGSAGTRALAPRTVNRVSAAYHVAQIDGTSTIVRGTGHRLIFALRTLRSLGLVDALTIFDDYQLYGIEDGPDPFGAKDKGIKGPTVPPSVR
jgi:hypothetical protein